MKNFEYKDHLVIIEKKRRSSERTITIFQLKPERKMKTTITGDYTLRRAISLAKDYIGF